MTLDVVLHLLFNLMINEDSDRVSTYSLLLTLPTTTVLLVTTVPSLIIKITIIKANLLQLFWWNGYTFSSFFMSGDFSEYTYDISR